MKNIALIAALTLAACALESAPSHAPEASIEALAPHDLGSFFDCLRESGQTVVAAHRGGPAPGFAENAIPTFENTLARASAMLEIDIARTRDGALVLMHDDEVDRTTNGSGPVRDLTLAQFQALSLEDETGAVLEANPPSLREALDWAEGRAVLELDVKRGVSYEDVVAAVREAGAEDRVIFITYSSDGAERVHTIAPELMLSVSVNSEADLDDLIARGIAASKILAWTGTREPNAALNVALAERGVEVLFGTLGRPDQSWDGRFAREGDQYAAFAETGIQVIATDRPVSAFEDLDAQDGEAGYAALQCTIR